MSDDPDSDALEAAFDAYYGKMGVDDKMYGNQEVEHMTMSTDDFLAHHGVKGMKWGQRRALKTTDRAIQLHKNARDGKGAIGVAAKLDKVTWGRNGRFEDYHNKKIHELENSKKNIEDGHRYVSTLLRGAQYTSDKKQAKIDSKVGITPKEFIKKGYVGSVQAKHDRVNDQRRKEGKPELNALGLPKKKKS